MPQMGSFFLNRLNAMVFPPDGCVTYLFPSFSFFISSTLAIVFIICIDVLVDEFEEGGDGFLVQ